tara:strand:- start:607 stop:816 length:210 start_codon:yes stop_codon:yes gene_type:complete
MQANHFVKRLNTAEFITFTTHSQMSIRLSNSRAKYRTRFNFHTALERLVLTPAKEANLFVKCNLSVKSG